VATDAELLIVGLGAQGDGIAEAADGPRYVPFALPGERVRPGKAGVPEVLSLPSAERRPPLCRHFGVCGGCVAQHMSDGLYADWKRGILVAAFRQRGIDAEVAPLKRIAAASRRRTAMTARCQGGQIVLGYHPRESGAVFQVAECPVLLPEIVARFGALRAIASCLSEGEIRLTLLATPAGLDVAIALGRPVGAKTTMRLAQLAAEHRLARISIDGQSMVERAVPRLELAGLTVSPPPGAFLQAVSAAEAAISEEVLAAAGKPRRAADLFCGLGTLAFALARSAKVKAIDSDPAAIEALRLAARHAKGLKPIEADVRDLFREPLSASELNGFDAVLFDPPRAGAKAQAAELARSRVPVVVAVSCYPGTLARDVRILIDGGYRLERVVPIDQFLFSAHVESVAYLRR
jgi:23S rRNA (uracil1939-C5)-methyltransferase